MEKKTKKIIKKIHNVISNLSGQLNLTTLFILLLIFITNYSSFSQNIFYKTNDTINNKIPNIRNLKYVDSQYVKMIDLPPFDEQKKVVEINENNQNPIFSESSNTTKSFLCDESENKSNPIFGGISQKDERWQKGGIYYGFEPEQEILERRTKIAKHFILPDGKYAAFIGSVKHYKDENGLWQDIDLTIKNNNTSQFNEYKYCNVTNNIKTFYTESPDSLGILLQYEDLQLVFWKNPKLEILNSNYESIKTINANSAKAVCNDNIIKYNDFSGIIDEFVIHENGIKNNTLLNDINWILNETDEQDFISFKQFISLSDEYKIFNNNNLITNNFEGESFIIKRIKDTVGFVFSPIIIYDNGINVERVYELITIPESKITAKEKAELDAHVLQVKYQIIFVDGGIIVSVIIPINWLRDNNRAYPVVIDPTVTIGTGTGTQRQPWGIYWGYERSAAIYLSSEIGATGITISTVKWNVSTAQSSVVPYILRFKTTTNSTLSADTWANMISGSTQVSNGTKSFSSIGWDGFTGLSYGYASNNLLVLCESNYTGTGTSSYPYFYYTSTSDNKHEYWYQDNSVPTGTGTVNTLRPDIYIEYIIPRPCGDCTPTDANLGTIGTTIWGYSISSNCGNGGKWVASFNGEAGYTYWFDLCNIGTGNFDADIKICDASCNILAGVDGSSSCGWRPNQFSWNCPNNGTYYVIIAPYSSYSSHTCSGTSANTFTMYYYKGLDYCGVVDHGGNDLTISSNVSVGGEHINIGTFTINSGVTATVNPSCHYFYVSANNIVINGTIDANGAGGQGGSGGTGGAYAFGNTDNCNGGYGGIRGTTGSGSGGGYAGGNGGNGSCRKQKCGGFLCSGNKDGFMGGGGGAGGGGGGSYGGAGGFGGYGAYGASWTDASGGSYGNGGNAGNIYGTATGSDIDWGSGGGGAGGGGGGYTNGTNGGQGGAGGGAISLIATNNCTITGTIYTNGTNGAAGGNGGQTSVAQGFSCTATGYNSCGVCSQSNYDAAGGAGGGAGGGSGGGVKIQADGIMTFTGSIYAVGGNGGNGGFPDPNYGTCHDFAKGGAGGGGGRVKIFVNPCLSHNISGTVTISGGNGGAGYMTGNNGSIGTYNIINLSMPYPTITATAYPSSICIGGSSTLTASGANTYSWSHSLGSGASKTVTPTTTTTYSVTGTNQYGCTASSTVSVTVNPLPTVTASASPTSICNGATSVLTASGANTYSWSGGLGTGASKTVTPSATTTYTVTGTSAAGCTGTTTVSVTVNPLPTVTASASPTSICNGATSVLTASGANTYSWSGGLGTGASKTVTPSATTTYTVTGTSVAGCTATTSVSVTVLPPINYGSVASGDETICYSDDPANITMAVLPSGSGSFVYQWYYQDGIVSCPSGSSTSGWTVITGATSSSYNPPSGLTGTRTYAVYITPSGTPTCGTSQWASGCRQVTVTGQMIWTGNAGDGNWHNAANWCGIVPTPALDAIIPNGCSTYPNNYSSTTGTCKTLSIASAASVSIANNITIDCEEDVINNGTLTMVGNATLKCGRNWDNTNGTFNAGNGTVIFDTNNGTINTGGNGAGKKFYNVECNAAGKEKTQNGAIDCDNNFTITAGTWNTGGNTMNIAGDWTNNDLFTHLNNTVVFDGAINQNISGSVSTTFYNLIFNNVMTTLNINTTVKNALSLTNGALELNQKILIIDNSATTAITRTNGYILSSTLDKNHNSKVQWNIGTIATGEYIFPFGISSTYLPFKFKVITAGVGNVSVSTYPTGGADATSVYANKPNVVLNINSPLYPDPPAPGNAINIVRRFWYINKSGGSGIADITFSWAASEDPLSGAINPMIAQRYLEPINKWEYPPLDAQSSSILTTPRYVTVPNVTNFSPWAITRNDHPLPITLLFFNGDCKDSTVELNWATASEINNDFFTIEYSNSLNDNYSLWTPIATIDGAGNSNVIKTYQYIDKPYKRDNSSEVIFYRLKQTDYNGSFTYSNTIDIHCLNKQSNDIEIIHAYCEQQNSCNVVNVLFKIPGEQDYTLKLYNVYGQQIATTTGISKDGYNQTQIHLNDYLDQAIYIVILLNNEKITTKKVLLY
jgi:hypothetical protein